MQTQAAQANLALSKQAADTAASQNAREAEQYSYVKPYYLNRLANGLPYMNQLTDSQGGLVARSFAPAYMGLSKQYATDGLPSGSRNAAFRSLDSDRARAFDSQLLQGLQLNDAAKQDAAAGLVGQQGLALNSALGNQNSALQGNSGIFNATTLTHGGIGGILGGIAGAGLNGLLSNPKLPF